MNQPMTELDVAKGLQFQLAGLDLNHPHARQMALELMSQLERSLDTIRRAEEEAEEAEWDRQHPLQHVAAEKFDFGAFVKDVYNPMVQAMYGKRGA